MPGSGYWQERFLRDKAFSINEAEKFIRRNQKKLYEEAANEIRKEIEKFYEKYAQENKISLAEAHKKLSAAEFKNIDWEAYCQYNIDLDRELKEKKETLPGNMVAAMEKEHMQYEEKIQTLAAKGRITQLELLQADIEKIILNTYDANQMNLYDYLSKEYEDGYYRGIFHLQQGIGFGRSFAVVHTKAVEKVILGQQKRSNFSQNLYRHKKNLTKEIKDCLTVGMIRGESVDKLSKRVQKRIDVSYSNAKRLVRTETAYVYEQATLDSYAECGAKKYRFMATLDHKTSEICQSLDGREFLVKEAMPGVNYPPMHPNCRSTTVAVFDDDKVTEKAARGADGKGYTVPSDMTYQEWAVTHAAGMPLLKYEEKYALNQYMSFESYKINEKLRTRTVLTEQEEKMVRNLDSALGKLPDYNGTVVRVLDIEDENKLQEFVKEHEPRRIIKYREYISASNKKGYNPSANIEIYINSTKGKNLTSFNSEEREVLYKRNSEFFVSNMVEKDGIIYIMLEEK